MDFRNSVLITTLYLGKSVPIVFFVVKFLKTEISLQGTCMGVEEQNMEPFAKRLLEFLEIKLTEIHKQTNLMRIAVTTSTKAILAYCEFSYVIAQNEEPTVIRETLGQSFWLQIQRSRVRFPVLLDFVRSRGPETGSTQPHEDN
jgi:hypothetical protein